MGGSTTGKIHGWIHQREDPWVDPPEGRSMGGSRGVDPWVDEYPWVDPPLGRSMGGSTRGKILALNMVPRMYILKHPVE
jgi:hypothetical protein